MPLIVYDGTDEKLYDVNHKHLIYGGKHIIVSFNAAHVS